MTLARWHWFVDVLIVGTLSAVSPAWAAPTVGQPSPALVADTLDGRTFDLDALRGKVVIVNFWATWCPPCREEMPALDAFYQRYRNKGVELIGMSADSPHDSDEVRKVMHAFAYPAAMLVKARSNGFGTPRMLPLTYVIDTKGLVRAALRPDKVQITEKNLADIVLPLLRPGENSN
jgi:cytochrome c biogenesis protein CcmG, thiol:disulfide interchange protein DsbE